MKISAIELKRFRRFKDKSISFRYEDSAKPLDLVILIGENGSGKSSILQAIALTLGIATNQLTNPNELIWPGFEYSGISANYRSDAEVKLTVQFSAEEREATKEYFQKSDYSTRGNLSPPGDAEEVSLYFTDNPEAAHPVEAISDGKTKSVAALAQFRGRQYAYNLIRQRIPNLFEKVGGVFWYHEQRTVVSITPISYNGKLESDDISAMRQQLTYWNGETGKPKFLRLQEFYARLFPGKTLSHVGETYSTAPPPVYFSDGNYEYELAELSGGERALLPMLVDFANWGINNSVILIDEIELHLHPPLQQTLLAVLPHLGRNNQFIITTHSDAVFDILPSENVIRVQ